MEPLIRKREHFNKVVIRSASLAQHVERKTYNSDKDISNTSTAILMGLMTVMKDACFALQVFLQQMKTLSTNRVHTFTKNLGYAN